MSLEYWVAAALVGSLLLFALAGGADFGGGIWTLLARGERAEEQARLVDRAIGPIWEANELWIVVALVILWTAFTPAFVALGISLFIPLILVLAGILLRGAFFAFGHEAEFMGTGRAYDLFGKIFGFTSLISPFFFGVAAGTVASGRLNFVNTTSASGNFQTGRPADGFFSPWIGPFPIVIGVLALVTCAYLAAFYLTIEADNDPSLQDDFRRRSLVSCAALGILGPAALPVAFLDAPYMSEQILQMPTVLFFGGAALSLAASFVFMYTRRYWLARAAAILEVVMIFGAWTSAQFPYLIVSDITVSGSASPREVLIAMLILSFFYAVVLIPALVFLLRLFKQRPSGRKGEY